MPAPFAAQQMKVVKFWDIGGVAYTFMGATANVWPTFADHYHRTADPEMILLPLRFFFRNVWKGYYLQPQRLTARTLVEEYEPIFELAQHERQVNEFFNRFRLSTELPLSPYEPLTWALNHAARSRFHTAQRAITHGDLHGDNLFVDQDRMWAIDFERTGLGHILRDFAELEVDILTRLVSRELVDDVTFYQVAKRLITPGHSSGFASLQGQENAETQKVIDVVNGLRQLAGELARFSDLEYLWALLLDALFVASINSAPSWQRQRAVILSSLIVELLR
jgi:hypothetical protein